jgi:ribosomal protein L7/L12
MDRDPVVALVTMVLILVGGSVAVIVGAMREYRKGARRGEPARQPSAMPVREGEWSLILEAAGPNKIPVIKELRAITGLGLADAKGLTDRIPATVLSRVDHEAASAAYRTLADAGAAVRITESAASSIASPSDAAGMFAVVVEHVGSRRIQVIKEIRALTGVGLAEAKHWTDRVPSPILSSVDHATATAAHGRLTQAGAAVRVTRV